VLVEQAGNAVRVHDAGAVSAHNARRAAFLLPYCMLASAFESALGNCCSCLHVAAMTSAATHWRPLQLLQNLSQFSALRCACVSCWCSVDHFLGLPGVPALLTVEACIDSRLSLAFWRGMESRQCVVHFCIETQIGGL
jgi:hypothetical protein